MTEWTFRMDAAIAENRPLQYKALCEECGYGPKFYYQRVFQFCACNFSLQDGRPDVDEDFNFITEIVPCPIRHKCKLNYCSFDSILSRRELDVVKLFAAGLNETAIADQLFISPSTAHNHITNIYSKLGLTGSAHPDRLLVSFAHNNKLV
jgi:DNA-binding CsgD family transcriptional regulator